MKNKIKVGIIGSGRMASLHLEVLSSMEDVIIQSICSTKSGYQKCKELCNTYNISKSYSNYNKMLENETLDCVFIAVSVAKMYEVTKDVLNKGIHSFIEKPPGLYLHETKKLNKIAQEKSLITSVGLQRRFYSNIQYAKKYIENNGKLISVIVEAPERFKQIKSKDKFPEEVLSRWIIANGIHCLDLLLYFGGEVKSVKTISKKFNENIHPDSLNALIEFDNNITGHYISNWMSPGGWSVKLYCDSYRIDIKPIEEGKIIFSDGTEELLPIDSIDKKFKPGVYEQDKNFINLIKDSKFNNTTLSSLEETLKLVEFCELFLTSFDTESK